VAWTDGRTDGLTLAALLYGDETQQECTEHRAKHRQRIKWFEAKV